MNAISHLLEHVSIGEPHRQGRLDIFPLFVDLEEKASFLLLDEALAARTVEVTETSDAGSVPVLKLLSRDQKPILLVDGEELVGAKQNRILNTSVLAPPGAELLIPVSCVEQGRWRYSSHNFQAADHALFAKARARKAERMAAAHARRKAAGGSAVHSVAYAFDANQSSVWSDVSDKLARMQVVSESSAISDGYERYSRHLSAFEQALVTEPGQRGAVFALNGRVVGIELLATEAAFSRIFRKLVRSYAFDALEQADPVPPRVPTQEEVKAFIARVLGASSSEAEGVGLGADLRLEGESCAGHALVHDNEVIHLAAFDRELAN